MEDARHKIGRSSLRPDIGPGAFRLGSLEVVTDTSPPAEAARIRSRVRELLPALREDLERLSRIPSVSLQTLDDYLRRRNGERP